MDGVLYIENINMYEREQHLDPDLSWLSILKLSSIIDCSETIPTTAFLSNFNRDEANTDWTIIWTKQWAVYKIYSHYLHYNVAFLFVIAWENLRVAIFVSSWPYYY